MDKKRMALKWSVIIIIMVAIGTIGFLIGQNISDSKYQAEQELVY